MEEKFDEAMLRTIYGILIRVCGAPELDREVFILYARDHDPSRTLEWRFIGSLGFGGKVWLYNRMESYVTCYPEDETPARLNAIEKANEELKSLMGISK